MKERLDLTDLQICWLYVYPSGNHTDSSLFSISCVMSPIDCKELNTKSYELGWSLTLSNTLLTQHAIGYCHLWSVLGISSFPNKSTFKISSFTIVRTPPGNKKYFQRFSEIFRILVTALTKYDRLFFYLGLFFVGVSYHQGFVTQGRGQPQGVRHQEFATES